MCLKSRTRQSTESCWEQIERLKAELGRAEAVVIGAGAGLSAAAGMAYDGERFERYFSDFKEKYGITDMYSGGFYPYDTLEEYWAWWSRHIYVNRYQDPPRDTYCRLRELVAGKEYFVLTTNVDHCFQREGFEKKRLFYTQGDYGLWQCSKPCHRRTYDNEERVREMLLAQGFLLEPEGELRLPEDGRLLRQVPSEMVPRCPRCGRPMTMNLRSDGTFVEDEGWHEAAGRYRDFLGRYGEERILYLELGVGANTPGIIKYPFWRMTYENPKAVYACVNLGEAVAPSEIRERSICVDEDIGTVLKKLK